MRCKNFFSQSACNLLTLRVHSACRANWLPRGDWPLLLSALWDGNTNKYRHQTAMLAFDLATTKGSKQAAVVPSRGLACVKQGPPLKWLSFLKSRTCLFILGEHVNQKTILLLKCTSSNGYLFIYIARSRPCDAASRAESNFIFSSRP